MFLRLNRRHHHFRERATTRRLTLERIEDRLLLDGVMQTGMEGQVASLQSVDSPFIVLDGGFIPSGMPLSGCSNNTTSLDIAHVDIDFNVIPRRVADNSGIVFNYNPPTSGNALIRFGTPDLPPSPDPPLNSPAVKTYVQEPIDIAVVYQAPAAPTADSSLPGSAKASPVVESKPSASKPFENFLSKPGVEGARGKAQIFDLAATSGGDAKPNVVQVSSLTEEPVGVEGKFTTVRLVSVSLPTRENASKSETVSAQHAAGASANELKPEAGGRADESAGKATSQSKSYVTSASNATATTGQPASEAPSSRIADLPHARNKADLDPPASVETHAQRLESNYGDRQADSAKPLQSADTAEAGRRAVFADMAKNDADPRFLPIFLPEHRRAELIGLAVAVVAGQPLMQKWRRRFDKDVQDEDDEMLPR